MPTREAEVSDGERIREVASSAMSSAYAISPRQIEAIVDAQFDAEAIEWKVENGGSLLHVATATDDQAAEDADLNPGDVVGVAEGSVDGNRGELRWLFVDPEYWGLGHGTALFEAVSGAARDRGARKLRSVTLASNEQGGNFCERLGFQRIDEREAEIGGETFTAHVYGDGESAETDADEGDGDAAESGSESAVGGSDETGGASDDADDDGGTEPSVEIPETMEADDGTRLYVGRDDPLSGVEGPFYQTFEDEAREEAYSYLCGKCGSTDVAMDDMGRIECEECGNQHRTKDDYDASYL
jgi:GNAT superfamily N-acetyltransferase/DNA-directed RNA polymerase subunit RPC12/RpoP